MEVLMHKIIILQIYLKYNKSKCTNFGQKFTLNHSIIQRSWITAKKQRFSIHVDSVLHCTVYTNQTITFYSQNSVQMFKIKRAL